MLREVLHQCPASNHSLGRFQLLLDASQAGSHAGCNVDPQTNWIVDIALSNIDIALLRSAVPLCGCLRASDGHLRGALLRCGHLNVSCHKGPPKIGRGTAKQLSAVPSLPRWPAAFPRAQPQATG